MVEIHALNKTYNQGKVNEFTALSDINLHIEQGELVAVVGKSGAGKSTLLHIIGCIEKYDSGVYKLANKQVSNMDDRMLSKLRCNKIGFVLQDFALINDESVLKNVCIPLYFDKTKFKDIKNKALSALETVGIVELQHKKVNQLSGGQKQRVALARAIVNEPAIILADEPTGALDTATSNEITELFRSLNSKGTTIIIVTHEMEVASKCGRIITLSDGKIV